MVRNIFGAIVMAAVIFAPAALSPGSALATTTQPDLSVANPAPGVIPAYYHNGRYYKYRYKGRYYRYRHNGDYYNFRHRGRYYRSRYRCGVEWCYR
jgi:hypothetical protein